MKYSTPIAKKIKFCYEKVFAYSCGTTSYRPGVGVDNCGVIIPTSEIPLTRNGCEIAPDNSYYIS